MAALGVPPPASSIFERDPVLEILRLVLARAREATPVDEDAGRAGELERFTLLAVLGDEVGRRLAVPVLTEARHVETDALGELLDVLDAQRGLIVEEHAMHFPEFALALRRDGRPRRLLRVLVHGQRVLLEEEANVALMVLVKLIEHGTCRPAGGTFEVRELDEHDRRPRGTLAGVCP